MDRVLLVEDEREPFDFFTELCEESGYGVTWTDATSKALEYLAAQKCDSRIDIIILDANQIRPEPFQFARDDEGLRLLRLIRDNEAYDSIPIVGITKFLGRMDNRTWKAVFTGAGGQVLFQKYPDDDEFMDAVDRLVADRRAGRKFGVARANRA